MIKGEKNTKRRIVFKVLNHLVTTLLLIVFIGMTFIVISTKASGGEPEIFGYQLKTVLSGSMEPEFMTGSVIAVKSGGDMTQFSKDDIITFFEDERLITHRIVDVVNNGEQVMYQTKGDNNNAPDSELVLSENVVAEYTGFTIPYLGYLVTFAQSQNGAFLLIIPGLLLLGYAGFTIWQALKKLEAPKKEEMKSE